MERGGRPPRRTRAVRAAGRAVPVGRVLAHWRAERRTIRQGLVALLVASAGNLVAGLALGSITGTLERLPGLMVLLPAAIGMRGNIFGALGSRLGTSIHSGLFEASRRRGSILHQNVLAATILTFSVSLALGVLAKLLSEAFGLDAMSVADFVVISLVAGVLSSVVVGTFTAGLSIRAYDRGWDLDSVTAPLVTAVGDVVTIPSLFLATFLVGIPWFTPAVAALGTAWTVLFTVQGLRSDLRTTKKVLRESLPLLAMAGTVDIFAGLTVEARLEDFVPFPVLLVLIPPLLADAGALGGILSSRLASKLHLGSLEPKGFPHGAALLDTSIVFAFAIWLFALVGVTADLAAGLFGMASPGMWTVMGIAMVAGLIATSFAVVIAYYTAIATFRLGWDPDSLGIPVITSSMDLIGAVALILTLVLFGLG